MDIRCFIAINLPEAVGKSMAEVIDGLKRIGADVKWVPAGNVHLTLKFLGNTPEPLVPGIHEALRKKLSHCKAFYIRITGIGCFPSEKRPRVVWFGVQDSAALMDIQKEIDAGLANFGFAPDDRPFSPHLTIGRVRSMKRIPELMRHMSGLGAVDFGTVAVDRIHIMKSELKATGAEYASLVEIPLGTGRNDVG